MSHLQVYYHPALARGAPLVRMLEHTGTPYEYISDRAKMAEVCSAWSGQGDTFAPPVVRDGDVVISQSVACALYVGKKLGLTPAGFDECKAVQHMLDIVDAFEGGLGKNNEQGPALRKFLEGERWPKLMHNLERGIKGPYYCGAEPCCVDFFLLAHLDWRISTLFDPLKEMHGVDALAPFPKALGVRNALMAFDAYTKYSALKPMGPMKAEILESYKNEV